ncbi:hypothetical protein HN865_03440 [Candidatus Woesearchaeota archaeon]|nr:hypothetical protein [Candidatus Woesearchaeota archaeon]MBT7237885.1 hypothetical protein [Candidatus Woesearchaeota archaeon]
MDRKGQTGINETILVMFVFFVILMLGMVLFFQFSMSSSRKEIEEYQEFKFKQLISVVPSMNELKYSKLGIDDEWCIDLLKARAFSSISDSYNFGRKKISIYSSEDIVLYDKISSRATSIRVVNSPVCIYDPRTELFSLAELEVKWEN